MIGKWSTLKKSLTDYLILCMFMDFRSFEVIKEDYETRTKIIRSIGIREQIKLWSPRQRAIMAGKDFHLK